MANYLVSNYKGVYRLKTSMDERTKKFPREYTGQFADNDIYIDCQNNIKIFHYGNRTLQAYIPSIIRGNNIIKSIDNGIVFDVEKTDSEVLFKFNSKHMLSLEPYLKPKKNGSGISPFSSKNLSKTKYIIPDKDLVKYKSIVENIPQKQLVALAHTTNNFLKTLESKSFSWGDIKDDMILKGLSGKNYIHSIGQWENYLEFIKEDINYGNG